MAPVTDRSVLLAIELLQGRLAQIAAEEEQINQFLAVLSAVAAPSPRRRRGTLRSAAKAQQRERPETEPPAKPAPRPTRRRRRKRSAQLS